MEPVRLLHERGIEPHIYYANSNIHPQAEYAHRLSTIRAWCVEEGVAFAEGAYDVAAWEATAGRVGDAARERFGVIAEVGGAGGAGAGGAAARSADAKDRAAQAAREGDAANESAPAVTDPRDNVEAAAARQARCRACYRLRFGEAAAAAREGGFDALGTTLTVSPYQYTDVIREELERAAEQAGIRAFFEDYRPYYDEATRRSRAAGMYRQNFCGCRFSDEEAAVERAERKRARAEARAREAAAHAEERAERQAAQAAKRAERQAYAEKQARKRAVLKALRNRDTHDKGTE